MTEKIIKTDVEIERFVAELEYMEGGSDIRALVQEKNYQHIVKISRQSFVIVFNEDYDSCNARLALIRVSTDTQAERGNGASRQLDGILGYCKMKKYNLCAIAFDLGISGDNHDRLIKLYNSDIPVKDWFKDIRPGLHFVLSKLSPYNKLLAEQPNRVWRDNDMTGGQIRFACIARGSDLEFVYHPTITLYEADPMAYLTMMFHFNIADFDRRVLIKRLEDGRIRSVLEGRTSSNTAYGYAKDKDGFKVVVPEEAEHVRMVFRLWKHNRSYAKTAAAMNEHGHLYRGRPWKYKDVEHIVQREPLHRYNGYNTHGKKEKFYEKLVIIPESECVGLYQ